MGADLPDDPDDHADRRDDQRGPGRHAGTGNGQAEPRDRQEYYADLRVAVAKQETVVTQRLAAAEQAATAKWQETATDSRWMWTEYQRRWPPAERPPADSSNDPPGSWRGDRARYLTPAANHGVEAECDRIAVREQERISPALRAIESQDPDRNLIGLEHCRKGRDRIKEKICSTIKDFNRSPEQAVSLVPDAIRYTFQYHEARYTQGVWADIGRMKEEGFTLQKLKNSWSDDQYKGINSQWVEPDTGQRFEVQFHTRISFEAKQLTHDAYERLRTRQPDKFEQMVLEAFQTKVTAEVPIPPGASDIPDYP